VTVEVWLAPASAGTRLRILGGQQEPDASPVKAVSRRRRWPKASLYRARRPARLGPSSLTADCH